MLNIDQNINIIFELCIQHPSPTSQLSFFYPTIRRCALCSQCEVAAPYLNSAPGASLKPHSTACETKERNIWTVAHRGIFLCSTLGSFVLTLWDILHHLEVHWLLGGGGQLPTTFPLQQCTTVATSTKGSRNLSHRAVPHGNKICRSSNWFVKYQNAMLMFLLSGFGNATTMCNDIFYSMYDWYRMKRHDLTKKDLPSW